MLDSLINLPNGTSTNRCIRRTNEGCRQWTFYVLIIWSGALLAVIIAFVPETYSPVLLRRKAVLVRKETGDERWKAPIEIMQRSILWTVVRSCYRPFLLLILEPMCLNLCLFTALLLGVLYLFFGAFEVVFVENHHFNLWQVGLSFTGLLVGQVCPFSFYLPLCGVTVKHSSPVEVTVSASLLLLYLS